MRHVKLGVVGVGNLGRRHALLAADLPEVELVGVTDLDAARAAAVAAEARTAALPDLEALLSRAEAVLIATPTSTHADLALRAFAAGAHVFVEKPMALAPAQARAMIDAARAAGRILQVGHVERFNPAVMELERVLRRPRFIEVHRLGPLAPQVRDVGVVLDLMIHDLDLILWLVPSRLVAVEAVGVRVVTEHEDIANARLRFASGVIANVTASRVTPEPQRKIRFFQDDAYISLDSLTRRMDVYHKDGEGLGMAAIRHVSHDLDRHNALALEIASFAACVAAGHAPRVSGEDGLAALELAARITELIRAGVPAESEDD